MSDWGLGKMKNYDEIWPKTESGEQVRPAFLQHVVGSQLDTEMVVNLLEAFGIPTVCQYPNNGEFGKLILGFSGTGMDIFVPETMLEDAQNIICGDFSDVEEEQ